MDTCPFGDCTVSAGGSARPRLEQLAVTTANDRIVTSFFICGPLGRDAFYGCGAGLLEPRCMTLCRTTGLLCNSNRKREWGRTGNVRR